jgi:dienelactone hydrolase
VIALLLVAFQEAAPAPAAEAPTLAFDGSELVVRSWLALAAVDARGRRPFRPDAVLARYLVEPGASPPREGESVKGETGEASWALREAGEDGRLGDVAWACARVTSEEERVVLAKLEGAGTLFVNGAPFAGDLYGYGFGGVPVALAKGANELFVTGVRGAFRLSLVPCAEGPMIGAWDLTVPTLTVGKPVRGDIGVLVLNASARPATGLVLEVSNEEWLFPSRVTFDLGPLEQRHLALGFVPRFPRGELEESGEFSCTLGLSSAERTHQEFPLELRVRDPAGLEVRTFRSRIDGTVQKYALLPPLPWEAEPERARLLLTLHGAGVDCEAQAASYSQKPDFWIVAPTNRRPFGFDWQDWGRPDAYEALEHALLVTQVPRERVHLSGHSMGGHGTWHLAANDPDGFASIAPSAGWRSFDTYGGRPEGALRALWHAADGASRTEDLLSNLKQVPTYVLHGEADDNVPAAEGHAMVAALGNAGAAPLSHFEPGAGHWWDDAVGVPGTACVDWPGFFELFRSTTIPTWPDEIDWTGVDPGVDSRHHWVEVEQPRVYGRPFRVQARFDAARGRLEVTTENVRILSMSRPGDVREVVLDGEVLPAWGPQRSYTPRVHVYLREDRWQYFTGSLGGEPRKLGPLKRALSSLLVVPTRGTPEENAAALARARHDQGQWSYRGNGDMEIVTDEQFLAFDPGRRRRATLYGNATTNAAWARVVREDFPLHVERGRARLGKQEWSGDDLGALAAGPRFALLASTGPEADRVAASLSLFVSGVGYPDYVVYGPEVLAQGDGGVRAAGFFDHRWQLQAAETPVGR